MTADEREVRAMSSYDRYKAKHKHDPKPEKVVLPEIGSIYHMEPYGDGIVVDKDKHSYRSHVPGRTNQAGNTIMTLRMWLLLPLSILTSMLI